MSKMSTETIRHALNGPTMGTRWSALFHTAPGVDVAPVRAAVQAAVDRVDAQMSTWRAQSDLMRLNAAPPGTWVEVPADLLAVLRRGLRIGAASGGAFDIGMGDAVRAWGFGLDAASAAGIRAAIAAPRRPAHELLEIGPGRVRKHGALAIDLNGIAKGYGVDRMAGTLAAFGMSAALVGIDGELRATGLRPDGSPWTVAVEAPDPGIRAAQSILVLQDAAVATSGDYRHWVDVQGRRLPHTMDPRRGAPVEGGPASVTVVAATCAEADAWATAMMVLGPVAGGRLARRLGLDVLFLVRDAAGRAEPLGFGRLFDTRAPSGADIPFSNGAVS